MSINLPVMCSLSDVEKREREATLLARFKSGVVAVDELGDGYSFRLSGGPEWLALIAQLMIAERECCPFLTFQLTAEPQMGAITVRITGPDGTKEFLKNALAG